MGNPCFKYSEWEARIATNIYNYRNMSLKQKNQLVGCTWNMVCCVRDYYGQFINMFL